MRFKTFLAIALAAVFFPLHLIAQPGQSPSDCSDTTVGLTSLTELGANLYQGFPGGLYPGGINTRPQAHDSAGLQLVVQVLPRDAAGNIDPVNGKVVLLSIGMSNTTQEFSVFKSLADADPEKNPKLVIVDGAQGGQTAATISDSNAAFWSVIDQRLNAAGVTRSQVQAAWIKEANANPNQAFPVHAQILEDQFVTIAGILRGRYPNLVVSYWSSRIYAGYANTTLNPEPYAYESGFSIRWMIERQINGDPALAYDGVNPRVPWISWGPYLWADGLNPRADSLIWECANFQSDGTHPSPSGRMKVANMLLDFFKKDSTTRPWFLNPSTTSTAIATGLPGIVTLGQNYPNPFNPGTTVEFSIPSTQHVVLKVYNLLGEEVATLVDHQRTAGTHRVQWNPEALSTGLYFYTLRSGSFMQTRKLILMK